MSDLKTTKIVSRLIFYKQLGKGSHNLSNDEYLIQSFDTVTFTILFLNAGFKKENTIRVCEYEIWYEYILKQKSNKTWNELRKTNLQMSSMLALFPTEWCFKYMIGNWWRHFFKDTQFFISLLISNGKTWIAAVHPNEILLFGHKNVQENHTKSSKNYNSAKKKKLEKKSKLFPNPGVSHRK